MKRELQVHLLPLVAIFLFTSLIWVLNKVPFYHFILLPLGLALGAFLLDLDHLIYWLFINPKENDSQLAAIALKRKDFQALVKLFETTHRKHTNLIFHHFFFQVVLTLTSLFVFTSSSSTLILSLLLATNLHILIDEIDDFYSDKKHLQNWLFARENKQLPISYLGYYIFTFGLILTFFALLLLKLPL